jgi:hypothetical protein
MQDAAPILPVSPIPHGTFSAPAAPDAALTPETPSHLAAEIVGVKPDTCNAVTSSASSLSAFGFRPSDFAPPLQPIQNIPAYLAARTPVLHYTQEEPLYVTLPDALKRDLRSLLGTRPDAGAFGHVKTLIKAGSSVHKAVSQARSLYGLPGSLKRLRQRYDLWAKTKDWVSLVNRSKCPAAWRDQPAGLPEAFLVFCEQRLARYRRADAKRQAVFSIHRQWKTGQNPDGSPEPIPGYEKDWPSRESQLLPRGWSYDNILDQLKKRARLNPAVTALIQQGTSAAKEFLPQHLTTRAGLRFLELVTFDDVRTDWLIFDPESGQPCELWLLVARDHATAMVLGFVMHPCLVRPDGTVSHLGLQEMKQLAAWLLERYPLPPYPSTWKLERGTATLPPAICAALAEMLPGHITFSYTSMIGGKSPVGYKEKAKGNSRGKASHESHNRLFHTQGAYIPGQTGNRWDIRPADLVARSDEAVETWSLRTRLPEHLRGQEKYPLLLESQAREHLIRICVEQNFRTAHDCEAFEDVLEWYDGSQWRPQSSYPSATSDPSYQFRTRKEMPVERAIKLMAPYAGQWTRCSPDILVALLSHTIRQITRPQIRANGEILFKHEGKPLVFAPPTQDSRLQTPDSLLGYLHPDDPSFLHVTDGRGSFLGTWYRRARLGYHDHELLAQAMRYTAAALRSVAAVAAELTSPERTELEAMRAHNQGLESSLQAVPIARGAPFTQIAPAPDLQSPISNLQSAIASALVTTRTAVKQAAKAHAAHLATEGAAAANDILAPSSDTSDTSYPSEISNPEISNPAPDDFLHALSSPEAP